MYAVVGKATLSDREKAESSVREEVVPQLSQIPGFVTGYWTRKGDTGLSMIVFESEDVAYEVADRIRSNPPTGVNLDDVEVREVVVHA